MVAIIITIALVLLILMWGVGVYNSLVKGKNEVKNAFANIDVAFKKRFDLIPNLVATVKEYSEHESDTLTKLAELRTRASSSNISNEEKMEVNNEITKTMGSLMVQVEAYPDLKANQNFLQLQGTLEEVATEIATATTLYNGVVTRYNTNTMTFPNVIIAGMLGFKQESVFEASTTERENVSVSDLFNK